MTEDRYEYMLDFVSRQQNRLVMYMVTGFVIGFSLGVLAAWLMYTIAK